MPGVRRLLLWSDEMKNLITILVLVLLAPGNLTHAKVQDNSSQREAAALVSQLSWESIRSEEKGLAIRFYPDGDAALKLVGIGRPATEALLKVLGDETKGVAAHIILSRIWEQVELGE
jgi:hypothetical protein